MSEHATDGVSGVGEVSEETWSLFKRGAQLAALRDGEWGGVPIPVRGLPLVIEPRYPHQGLNGFSFGGNTFTGGSDDSECDDTTIVRNTFVCQRRHCEVFVCQDTPDGPVYHLKLPVKRKSGLDRWIGTLGASDAWDVPAECRALETLKSLVSDTAFHRYFLTGTFLETSKRSGVTYLFRKLRPTVAIGGRSGDMARILTTLCLHPIGYYEGTWAGVMCPTDDVIAHLLMMRGDEHLFWRKANHHDPDTEGAGI